MIFAFSRPLDLGSCTRNVVCLATLLCALQACGSPEPPGPPSQNAVQSTVPGRTPQAIRVDQPTVEASSFRPSPGPERAYPDGKRSGSRETGPNFRATVIAGQSNGEAPPTWMVHIGDVLIDGDVTVVGTDLLFRPVDLGVAANVCQAIAAQVVDQEAIAANARVRVLDANGRVLIETGVNADGMPDCSPGVHPVR